MLFIEFSILASSNLWQGWRISFGLWILIKKTCYLY